MSHYLVAEVGEDPIVHKFPVDEVIVTRDERGGITVLTARSSGYRLLLTLSDGYWAKVELVEDES